MKARNGNRWRKRMFVRLIARDGPRCQLCAVPHRTIWRNAGGYSTGSPDHLRYIGIIS